jgi:hypothetical protein
MSAASRHYRLIFADVLRRDPIGPDQIKEDEK